MVVLKSLPALGLLVLEPEIDMLGLLQYPAFCSEQSCVQSQPKWLAFCFSSMALALTRMSHFDTFRIH